MGSVDRKKSLTTVGDQDPKIQKSAALKSPKIDVSKCNNYVEVVIFLACDTLYNCNFNSRCFKDYFSCGQRYLWPELIVVEVMNMDVDFPGLQHIVQWNSAVLQ